jgi:hypothetical protein
MSLKIIGDAGSETCVPRNDVMDSMPLVMIAPLAEGGRPELLELMNEDRKRISRPCSNVSERVLFMQPSLERTGELL